MNCHPLLGGHSRIFDQAIVTTPSSTAHRGIYTQKESVGAILQTILVRGQKSLSSYPELKWYRTDYEWYSCLKRYDAMF